MINYMIYYIHQKSKTGKRKMKKTQFSKYIFSLLLFGTNGLVASLIDLTGTQIVFLRTLIGSIFLLAIYLLSGKKLLQCKEKKQFVFVCISGMAMGASWMFLYEAYNVIGVSIASLLYYCGPVIVMLLSPVIFKEKLTIITIAGFAAVLAGIFCVNGGASGTLDTKGLILGLLSAVSYAVMVIFNKKADKIVGLENSVLQLLISFLTVAVFMISRQGLVMHIEPSSIIPIIVLGVVNTGIGCYLYFSSIGKLPVQTVSICGYLEPLSAVVFSVIILGESMQCLQIFGALLILGGAAASELLPLLKHHAQRRTLKH